MAISSENQNNMWVTLEVRTRRNIRANKFSSFRYLVRQKPAGKFVRAWCFSCALGRNFSKDSFMTNRYSFVFQWWFLSPWQNQDKEQRFSSPTVYLLSSEVYQHEREKAHEGNDSPLRVERRWLIQKRKRKTVPVTWARCRIQRFAEGHKELNKWRQFAFSQPNWDWLKSHSCNLTRICGSPFKLVVVCRRMFGRWFTVKETW